MVWQDKLMLTYGHLVLEFEEIHESFIRILLILAEICVFRKESGIIRHGGNKKLKEVLN